ncbi:DNA starvation/stationary phase protection protein Dps [Crocosphaera sp. Alani8]|uniref:DNA starvation/stationary phase protection protein Dps n=1 Tax=Crocosphaera sp. Alani8 TaxID=3038952 RepID=UPI00313B574F
MPTANITNSPNASSKARFYPSRIDISADIREKVVAVLAPTLATSIDLKTQAKQAHWNVKGLDFYQLHELFDTLAGELEGYVDMFAERITALGGTAMGTARIAANESLLAEYPFDAVEGMEHIKALAERYATYGAHLREGIDKMEELGEADTADLYTEVSREVDKRLWFLEAHLVKKSDIS